MLKKMQRQFILVAMISFALVMIGIIIGVNGFNHRQMRQEQDRILQGIYEYETLSSSDPDAEQVPISDMPWAGGKEEEFTTRFFVVRCTVEGDILQFENDYISSVDLEMAAVITKDVLLHRAPKGTYHDFRYLVSEEGDERLIVFLNISEASEYGHLLLFISILIGIVSMATVFVLLLILSKRSVRPYMESIERQKRFITDASHELKTPITSISTSADIAAMTHENDEWIENIQKQSARLSHLANDLVTLSRLDEEIPYPERSHFSLSEATWEIAESFSTRAKALNMDYILDIDDNVEAYGDRSAIQQMISLLLDNALKYSVPNGKIRLHVFRKRAKSVIEVSNTCHIDGSLELDRLFDRFYRPDESRSSLTGGSGLGLSIVKSITEAYGGKISVSMTDPETILFRIVL